MSTEDSTSNSASMNMSARDSEGSTLASKVKLRRLTLAKTQQKVELTTKTSASSEYFAVNSRNVDEKLVCKRKRAVKNVPKYTTDSEKLNTSGNSGSPVVDCAKSVRHLRGKCQSTTATKETVKRKACKKRDSLKVMPPADIDVQSYSDNGGFAAAASLDENNNTSSSDVEWEDVEGRNSVIYVTKVMTDKTAKYSQRKNKLKNQNMLLIYNEV